MSALKLAIVFVTLLVAYCVDTEFERSNAFIELEFFEKETNLSDASQASAVTEVTREENRWKTWIVIAVIVIILVIVIAFAIGIAIGLCCRGKTGRISITDRVFGRVKRQNDQHQHQPHHHRKHHNHPDPHPHPHHQHQHQHQHKPKLRRISEEEIREETLSERISEQTFQYSSVP